MKEAVENQPDLSEEIEELSSKIGTRLASCPAD